MPAFYPFRGVGKGQQTPYFVAGFSCPAKLHNQGKPIRMRIPFWGSNR
jgi:hypothetical protein